MALTTANSGVSHQTSRLNPAGGIFALNVLFDTLNPYIIIDRPKSLILG